MERDYDLFEILPDGGVMWRQMVPGQENAVRKLEELSKRTLNESSRNARSQQLCNCFDERTYRVTSGWASRASGTAVVILTVCKTEQMMGRI